MKPPDAASTVSPRDFRAVLEFSLAIANKYRFARVRLRFVTSVER